MYELVSGGMKVGVYRVWCWMFKEEWKGLGLNVVFFFKQKTAYEMLRSLVGSEMCIRDRLTVLLTISLSYACTVELITTTNENYSVNENILILSLIHI